MSDAVETMLERALAVVLAGDQALRKALDELPAAIYVTDADGVITYFNPACIDFTGRRPQVGADRWCVTWRLYTNAGDFLPHAECPMAVAINTRRPIRGVTAVAERPDGTRVVFRPYPTPIFDKDGRFAGAVNLLEDVTDEARAEDFQAQARRCRRLANAVADDFAADTLSRMAEEYEAKAAELLGHNRFANSRADGNEIRQAPTTDSGDDGPETVAGAPRT
ncbi:PAS domain-containing protein [Bradyrhizobium sp. WSM 1704]|uniref:PAS domain-containing protein n=1 Tax=Bradyrhizobium semiaridum TaxID=2821404 RepID=UPI001CE3AE4B|nr:PAS domain-containing protein [Bradyrhizobium semiaridum]MCA6122041.1 PAS domain-containing protein [Bradyrhizobium semiaridum]